MKNWRRDERSGPTYRLNNLLANETATFKNARHSSQVYLLVIFQGGDFLKVTTNKCNICQEHESNCDLIGVDSDDDCKWHRVDPEETEIHICHGCFQELHHFWSHFDQTTLKI